MLVFVVLWWDVHQQLTARSAERAQERDCPPNATPVAPSVAPPVGPPEQITPLPPFLVQPLDADTVDVSGTWTIPDPPTPDDRIVDPVNSVDIRCWRSSSVCTEALARVASNGKYLRGDLIEWTITRWTPRELTAEAREMCVTTTLTINLAAKEVFKIVRNGGWCENVPNWRPPDNPIVWKLVDGFHALDPRTR
jgi:hypothetical protein